MTHESSLNKEIRKLINFIDNRIEFKGCSSEGLNLVRTHLVRMLLDIPGCNENKEARLLLEKRIQAVRILTYKLESSMIPV